MPGDFVLNIFRSPFALLLEEIRFPFASEFLGKVLFAVYSLGKLVVPHARKFHLGERARHVLREEVPLHANAEYMSLGVALKHVFFSQLNMQVTKHAAGE